MASALLKSSLEGGLARDSIRIARSDYAPGSGFEIHSWQLQVQPGESCQMGKE